MFMSMNLSGACNLLQQQGLLSHAVLVCICGIPFVSARLGNVCSRAHSSHDVAALPSVAVFFSAITVAAPAPGRAVRYVVSLIADTHTLS